MLTPENQKLKYSSNQYNNKETTLIVEFLQKLSQLSLGLGINLKKLFMAIKLCASTYLTV